MRNDTSKTMANWELIIGDIMDVTGMEISESQVASIALLMTKLQNFRYEEERVIETIKSAWELVDEASPYRVAEEFVRLYKLEETSLVVFDQVEESVQSIVYQYSPLCTLMFPHSKTDATEINVEHKLASMKVVCNEGVPYGSVARLVIMYCNMIAVKYNTQTIRLGRNMSEFIRNIGYTPRFSKGRVNETIIEQVEKLFASTIFMTINERTAKDIDGETKYINTVVNHRFNFFETKVDLEEMFTGEGVVFLKLDSRYFEELKKHPVPLDYDTVLSLKKSPLAIDLYCYLTYRGKDGIKYQPIEQIQRQFGNSERPSQFRKDLVRALAVIKKNWPECSAEIKKEGLYQPPSTRHIVLKKQKKN